MAQLPSDEPFASIKALNAAVIERLAPTLAQHGFKAASKTAPLFFIAKQILVASR
jgi:hypothetical protein